MNVQIKQTIGGVWKKWTTYMSNTKKQVSYNRREARRTGGGPPLDGLSSLQDKIVEIIGETYNYILKHKLFYLPLSMDEF
jgi:hypothetical protein